METISTLRRERKDALIEKLVVASKEKQDMAERLIAAAIAGGLVGFVIGVGW